MRSQNQTGTLLIALLGIISVILVGIIVWDPSRDRLSSEPANTRVKSEGTIPFSRKIDKKLSFTPPAPPPHSLRESSSPVVRELNEQGLALYERGEFEDASERFESALGQNPSDAALRKNLGYAKGSQGWKLIESGELHNALLLFKKAVALIPEEAAFYLGMGLIYYRLNEEDNALDMLEAAISYRANDPQPFILLGEIYYGRDELDLSVGYLEKAAELTPGDRKLENLLTKARREQSTQGAFQRQATIHFTVKFEGREEYDTAREITGLLEDAYREIGQSLSAFPQTPITVILYSEQQFRDVTLSPKWSQGIFDGKIRLPIEGMLDNPNLIRKIVKHEYTHALIYDLTRTHVPTWLNEGIALHLEGPSSYPWDEAIRNHIEKGGTLIPLKNLHQSFLSFSDNTASLAYAESFSATQYLIDRYGLYRIRELLLAMKSGSTFEGAFQDHFMTTYDNFIRNWQSEIE